MRILITGGAGFIGSHAAKRLARSGFTPVTLDNLSTGHRSAVKWGPFIQADLSDREALREILLSQKIGGVLHLAGDASVSASMADPQAYYRNNMVNTLNLLDAMREAGITHLVFTSTCSVYGEAIGDSIPESHPQVPINAYGESKLAVERMLKWYGAAYGLRWVALRCFNVAGADPEGELGEDHRPETHLIPSAIQAALGLREALEVSGNDFPTPDGTAIRDYVHAGDVAEAHVRALHYVLEGGSGESLNIGSGEGHSVLDVVRTVEAACRRDVPLRFVDRRPGDPARLVADSSKARRVLGWSPSRSRLPEMAADSWRWMTSESAACR